MRRREWGVGSAETGVRRREEGTGGVLAGVGRLGQVLALNVVNCRPLFLPVARLVPFLALLSLPSFSAAPRLLEPVVAGNTVTLRLQADAGASCRIEGSTNLSTWFTVASGTAQGGLLTVQHSGPGSLPWLYYRGVQVGTVPGGAPFGSVTAAASTNAMATAIVVPEQETVLRLEGPGRVTYTLTLPIHSVSEPTLVRISALTSVAGLPNQRGLLAGARLEPAGWVPLAPVFLQLDFPGPINARQISSFAFDNSGSNLHLVPDVVVANAATNRVRILVSQFRSHGCGEFTVGELETQAATVPPARRVGARAGLMADMAGCYPDDEAEAREMQEDLEDAIRPRQQEAAAILGAERQSQLLGTGSEDGGFSALVRVMESSEQFYQQELQSRVPASLQKCALARTLAPWVLGIERQRALLGGGEGGGAPSASAELLCAGGRRCQEQAMECCRTQGGDTRLVQTVLGIERQRALLGAGAECGQPVSLEDLLKTCAPQWFGTLRVRISGRYLQTVTNGPSRFRRSKVSDLVLEASVLSAKVKINQASLFAPAYTNITCVLGGAFTASDRAEKVEESLEQACPGKPVSRRRDVWESSGSTNLNRIEVEALIMAPGTENFFVSPSLRILSDDAVTDARWVYEQETNKRSQFSDEDCLTTVETGGSYERDSGRSGVMVFAKATEFSWTADTLRYSYQGPEEMSFDFAHPFLGTREIQLELRRVR